MSKNSQDELVQQLKQVNSHKIVRAHNSYWKLFWLQFFKGTAFGLGSVIGATAVVTLVIFFISKIELVPILGEWISEIIMEIKSLQSSDL